MSIEMIEQLKYVEHDNKGCTIRIRLYTSLAFTSLFLYFPQRKTNFAESSYELSRIWKVYGILSQHKFRLT